MFALLAQCQFWSRVFGFYVGCVTANGAGHFHFLLRQTLQMQTLSATLQLICPLVRSAEVMPLTDYGAEQQSCSQSPARTRVTSHVLMRYIFPWRAVSWYGRAPISLHHKFLWELVFSKKIQGKAVHGSLPIKSRLGFAVCCGINAAIDRQLILQAAAKRVAVGRVWRQRGT